MQDGKPGQDDEEAPAAPTARASWYAQGLSDGLGDRLLMFDNSDAPSLELLRFRPDFAGVPGFEAALRERVQRLRQFRHPAFAQVRSVQRLEPDNDLALVSNFTPGRRLSEVLQQARGPAYAAALIRQLAPALVLLQQHDGGIPHGALNPDRIIVSPEGRLTIVEHVVGPALDRLRLPGGTLTAAGVPLPPAADGLAPRLDIAADWYQLALVALAVLLGRPVTSEEVPNIGAVLDQLADPSRPDADRVPAPLRRWLDRALQRSGPRIASAADALDGLREWLRLDQPGDATQPTQDFPRVAAPRPVIDARRTTPRPTVTGDTRPRRWRDADLGPGSPSGSATRPDVSPVADPPWTPSARPLNERAGATRTRREAVAGAPARGVTAVVAALGLLAAAEAGVIVGLSRAVWFAARPPIAIETSRLGEALLISDAAPDRAPLRVTVAPDLQWVRVATKAPGGATDRPAADGSGQLQISAPITLQVFEQSRLVGSVPGAAFTVPSGVHDLELVNAALGYRLRQAVEVEAGQTVSLHVAPAAGWLTVDAEPWAEVSVDGKEVGRTPVVTLAVAAGEHEIAFRHPALGSDRQRVTVRTDAITRVTGNLRR